MKKIIVFGLILLMCLSFVSALEDTDLVAVPTIEIDTNFETGCENNLDCSEGYVCQNSKCIAFCSRGSVSECNDGVDNDGDGLIDTDDDDCINEAYYYERTLPSCSDLIDNDGDGLIDMGDDGCESEVDDVEWNAATNVKYAAGEEQGFFAKVWDFLIFWN